MHHAVMALLLLCATVALCAAPCLGASENHPPWLLGLENLRSSQPAVPRVRVRPYSTADDEQPPDAEAEPMLLRPRRLPPRRAPVAGLLARSQARIQAHSTDMGGGTLDGHDGDTSSMRAYSTDTSVQSVAGAYGLSASRLEHIMQHDGHLRATPQGLLVWSCGSAEAVGPHTAGGGLHRHRHDSSTTSSNSWPVGVTPNVPSVDGSSRPDSGSSGGSSAPTNGGQAAPLEEEQGLKGDQPEELLADAEPQRATLMAPAPAAAVRRTARASTTARPARGQQPGHEDVLRLHSRAPGSTQHTVFLDFRGCSISGTWWNAATKKEPLQTQPFDLDGDPATLGRDERQAVLDIWMAVAQDFAPWAVDITTEDPGQEALIRSSEADTRYGMHVCIGGSSATTVGGLSGGLAFTGAWGQLGPGLQPVLVFPEQLGNGHARAVADSISHEVGHTFGLQHFGGAGTAPYNEGDGPWGPLLGLPYARTLSQWSRGQSVSASMQDDLQAISSQLARVADDHGDSPAAATALCAPTAPAQSAAAAARPGSPAPQHGSVLCGHAPLAAVGLQQDLGGAASGSTVYITARARGTISDAGDVDVFSIRVLQPGLVTAQLVLPSSTSGLGINNLVASVSITGADGQRTLANAQASTGSETALEAHSLVSTPGLHHIVVAPAALAPAGSTYGSLGDYELHVTFPGGSSMLGRQGTTTASSGLLVPVAPGSSSSTPGLQLQGSRHFPHVQALSPVAAGCSTAVAGGLVLLNFTAGSPPACWDGGSILAAAPQAQLLPNCPCRQHAHELSRPHSQAYAAVDGSYTCVHGAYSYAWHVPQTPGCYRLAMVLADGSRMPTTTLQVRVAGNTS